MVARVLPSPSREYGRARLVTVDGDDPLFRGVTPGTQVWMSHGDTIEKIPDGYTVTGSTADVRVAAFRIEGEEELGDTVPPGSVSYYRGKENTWQFYWRDMRLPR